MLLERALSGDPAEVESKSPLALIQHWDGAGWGQRESAVAWDLDEEICLAACVKISMQDFSEILSMWSCFVFLFFFFKVTSF